MEAENYQRGSVEKTDPDMRLMYNPEREQSHSEEPERCNLYPTSTVYLKEVPERKHDGGQHVS